MEGDINMSNQKRTFSYSFPTEETADQFLTFVSKQFPDNRSQFPKRTDGTVDKLQVLVNGTGSMNFDLSLLRSLDKKAEEFGGVRTR